MTATPQTDEELVAAFTGGDELAFSELVERYERRVYGICYRYFGDAADAEDAAQDAFLALYRRAGTFSGAARFSTWMYRVTTNACNDLARKRSRRPQRSAVVVEDLPIADPADPIGRAGLALDLKQALLQLEPEYRDAVVGHTVHGRPYGELADEMGVPVGTVKSRVHRGHAKLATILRAAEAAGAGEPSGRAPPHT